MDLFRDRFEAGRLLAERLRAFAGREDAVVLALPPGGVPVAFELASRLALPLDVLAVRPLRLPGDLTYQLGAVATGGVRLVDERVLERFPMDARTLEVLVENAELELAREERVFRGNRPPLRLRGKTVLLVDEALEASARLRPILVALRERDPERVVVAVPVGERRACEALASQGQEVVCALRPEPFETPSSWYVSNEQPSDTQVHALLAHAARARLEREETTSQGLGAV